MSIASAVPGEDGQAQDLVGRVRSRLIADAAAAASPSEVASALRQEGVVLGDAAVLSLVSTLRSELTGAGPLDDLVADPEVTDVLVNGPDEVWVDRGHGLQRADLRFRDDDAVRRLAQRLAASAGRRLDEAAPYVDARLPGGTRLHAVLPPVSGSQTLVSLRVGRRRPFTLDELVDVGTVPPGGAAWLRAIVARRLAYVVSGGTGTGKTTVLATLLSEVDPRERLVLVEDAAELRPAHPHVVRLEARPPNLEGAGAVTLRDLVRQALRMRPDRLVVGEVRGAEVVDLLAALNTGHDGGCSTLHANSAADVPARLEALALAAGLGRDAVHAQVAAGLDAVVHLQRRRDGRRTVEGIHVLRRGPDEFVRAVPALRFSGRQVRRGPGIGALYDLLRAR
ncbi:MAG: TadA family conjugal transfer-associated ATPase [Actinomycetota bacterium]|nr:MAG: TadA family conjugal transfer-associated ATPase [Actinomycetota bacterium]